MSELWINEVLVKDRDKLPCKFLDGPYRGTKNVNVEALEEGKLILGDTYQVQWNGDDWCWEAVTVTTHINEGER